MSPFLFRMFSQVLSYLFEGFGFVHGCREGLRYTYPSGFGCLQMMKVDDFFFCNYLIQRNLIYFVSLSLSGLLLIMLDRAFSSICA